MTRLVSSSRIAKSTLSLTVASEPLSPAMVNRRCCQSLLCSPDKLNPIPVRAKDISLRRRRPHKWAGHGTCLRRREQLHQQGFDANSAWVFISSGFALGSIILLFYLFVSRPEGSAIRYSTRFREYALGRKQEDAKKTIELLSKMRFVAPSTIRRNRKNPALRRQPPPRRRRDSLRCRRCGRRALYRGAGQGRRVVGRGQRAVLAMITALNALHKSWLPSSILSPSGRD